MSEVALSGVAEAPLPLVALLPEGESLSLLEGVPTAWVEQADRQRWLVFAHLDEVEDVGLYRRGRVSSETFELRWEPADGTRLHICYVGDEIALPGLFAVPGLELASLERQEAAYDLWGERLRRLMVSLVGEQPLPNLLPIRHPAAERRPAGAYGLDRDHSQPSQVRAGAGYCLLPVPG